ncbi:MAG: VWA domain-containing protein, partial [Planctomycetales bacterium]
RDSVDLPRGVAWGLCLLRCVALFGILFYFLDLEKREERKLVRRSRALVLVDTSLSMGIQDGADASGAGAARRRIDLVVDEFSRADFLRDLRRAHDVIVYRFDQQTTPTEVATFPRIEPNDPSPERDSTAARAAGLSEARWLARFSTLLVLASVACWIYAWFRDWAWLRLWFTRRETEERDGAWSVLAGMVTLLAGLIVFSVANLRHPELELGAVLGWKDDVPPSLERAESGAERAPGAAAGDPPIAWQEEFGPRGLETRIGDSVRFVLNRERGGPIAGVVVVSDGGNNAGGDLQESIQLARAFGIPVHAIGLGGDKRPTNVRVTDLEAPPRIYPGDAFPITGYLQASNLAGQSVKVELLSQPGRVGDPNIVPTVEETRQVTLGRDGELLPLPFEVVPQQAGQRTYQLRVTPPGQDADPRDNARSATVQIVERKSRVLLFAGAANREYQFLRNVLYRDKETTVDVLLQTGSPGISQEADELLFEFPRIADELFAYDALFAFDPDWSKLDDGQIELLERWVADKAGGLVLVAGPVHTPKLVSARAGDGRLETIRGLYPVVFFGRGSATLSLSRTSSGTPWPLQFTRDGQDAEFLKLADDPQGNEQAWSSYPGVFGYVAVKDVKPGAKVLARFSDPATEVDGNKPVYLATQFYGAGRVVYQGSGEMWRLRQADEAFFDRYYTKLTRWVSQGRLLRDSNRGLLLVDKERCLLGETVTVQGILTDSQHQPLTLAEVTAVLIPPDGRRANLPLRRVTDAARPGMYSAQFTAALEGDYRIDLALPGGQEQELLSRELRARIPALETESPERNDPLLKDLAEKTGGEYFIGFDAALNRGANRAPLASRLEPQDQTTFLPGAPDREFDRMLMTWLMAVICGALCLEWLLRRLNKLA